MKRNMISFFTLLFLIIITVFIFITLVNNEKKSQQTAEDALNKVSVTVAPTEAAVPSITPELTAPAAMTQLYPAFQVTDSVRKYGYIDKTGNFIIAPAFDSASYFHDGLAVAELGGKYLVINDTGSVIYSGNTPVNDYRNGAAVFKDKNLYGYIDTKGKIIIDAQYKAASDFGADDSAYVKTGKGEYARIDKTGKVLETYSLGKKYDSKLPPQDGYLIISGSKGVVNMKGEVIIEPKYSGIRYLGCGLFAVEKSSDASKSKPSKEAIFNDKGDQLTDYNYYNVGEFENGYASATDETTTFFISTNGYQDNSLPAFEGIGTVMISGDVIAAYIENQLIYCTANKSIFWQEDDSITLSGDIKIEAMKFRPYRFVLVEYPKVDGLEDQDVQDSINQELQKLFTDSRKGLTTGSDNEIYDTFSAALLNDLLIIERDADVEDSLGASQDLSAICYYYIDIRTGIFYQFKDLFLEGSDYVTKINEMITTEISKNSENTGYTFAGITDPPQFKLDESAVTIYFSPLEIASAAEGYPEFVIPFADIAEYINKEGAFWTSFNK